MKKILLILLIFIVLIIGYAHLNKADVGINETINQLEELLAYDLSDFPEFIEKSYVDTLVITGDGLNISDIVAGIDIMRSYDDCAYLNFTNSTDISKPDVEISLPGIYPPPISSCRSAPITLASNITNLSAKNIISVGGPCANKVTAQIMELSTMWPECAEGFEDGKGIIKLYKKWGKTQLVVAGYSAEDTYNAGEVLAHYINHNLSGKEIEVTGNISNPIIKRVMAGQEKKYCEKDEDCIKACLDCCPCWAGADAYNKEYIQELGINPAGNCSGKVTILGCRVGIKKTPICKNNTCTLISVKYDIESPYNLSLCKGSADCFTGKVTYIADGDTLHVNGISIRLALTNTPESNEPGFNEAKKFTEKICPIGSLVLVDEDDGQTAGSYGRTIAVVYCGTYNLNEQLLEAGHGMIWKTYCDKSEFGNEKWAVKFGC